MKISTQYKLLMPILGNVTIQVVLFGAEICNQCLWRHLVANFLSNASDVTLWQNLGPMQLALPGG